MVEERTFVVQRDEDSQRVGRRNEADEEEASHQAFAEATQTFWEISASFICRGYGHVYHPHLRGAA
jgi:hypothetical protein